MIAKRRQPLGHLIERLIPGEALPLISAAFPRALQGEIEAGMVIEVIDKQLAAGTKPPAGNGMVGVAFDFDRATVFDAQAHTAARVAETTKRSVSFRHGKRTSVVSLSPETNSSVPPSLVLKKPDCFHFLALGFSSDGREHCGLRDQPGFLTTGKGGASQAAEKPLWHPL
jgi:hypothetical protein